MKNTNCEPINLRCKCIVNGKAILVPLYETQNCRVVVIVDIDCLRNTYLSSPTPIRLIPYNEFSIILCGGYIVYEKGKLRFSIGATNIPIPTFCYELCCDFCNKQAYEDCLKICIPS